MVQGRRVAQYGPGNPLVRQGRRLKAWWTGVRKVSDGDLVDAAKRRIDVSDGVRLSGMLDYAPLARCVDLVSRLSAQLIAGTLRVEDTDGNRVVSRRADYLVELLRTEPDQVESGYRFWSRVAYDYATNGNALMVVQGSSSRPARLRRMDASSATAMRADGTMVWGLAPVPWEESYSGPTELMEYSNRDVVHVSWGIPRTRDSVHGASPITLLARAILTGREADDYVYQFFDDGPNAAMRGRIVVKVPRNTNERQLAEFRKLLAGANGREPLVLFAGMEASTVDTVPSDQRITDLRLYQARDVGSLYGMPDPLLGIPVTQWGTGVSLYMELAWRAGLRQHVDAILEPLSHRLLPYGQKFAVDAMDFIRGDVRAASSIISVMGQVGGMSKEEARRQVGLPSDMNPDHEPLVVQSGIGDPERPQS